MGCLAPCFARVEPRRQARKYVTGLISDVPRKNCWSLAEQAGDATPDKMQRLLERAAWEAGAAMRAVRAFAVARLGDPADAVLVLDESGQEKAGEHTAGVKRQYMGCAGPGGQRHQRRLCQLCRPGRACRHRGPAVCAQGLGR